MECCNQSQLRLVRGNDFTIKVIVKKPVAQSDGTTALEAFDVSNSTDIAVNLVSRIGRKTQMAYTVSDDGALLIGFDETVPSGMYGIEVTGKEEGSDWRFYAQPGEFLQIVEPSSAANIPTDTEVDGYYNFEVSLGILSIPNDLMSEMKEATAATKEATDAANTAAADANESATNANAAAKSASDAADSANKAAEAANTAAEGAEKVNAEFADGKIIITNRNGESKAVDSADMKETVTVALSTDVDGVSVSGTTLNVYLNHATTPQQYVTDGEGKATFDVAWGNYYEVVFPDKAGCKSLSPVGYTATISSRTIEGKYEELIEVESEKVTVTVTKRKDGTGTAWEGATVYVKIGSTTTDYTTDENGNVTFAVELGKEYTVSMDEDVDGWYTHLQDYSKTYTAHAVTRQVWFTWYPYRTGVFVIGTDGVEYTEDEWDAAGKTVDDAVFYKVVTEALVKGSGVVYMSVAGLQAQSYPSKVWSNPSWNIDGIANSTASANYWNGLVSTDLILASAEEQGGEVPAAQYCHQQSIEVAGKTMQGYLPAIGQWQQVWLNVDVVDAWQTKLYGDDAKLLSTYTTWKWASTQTNASFAMYFSSSPGSYIKDYSRAAVPFFA